MDAVDCSLKIRRNQERIMSGPQVLRSISPRVFQVCIYLSLEMHLFTTTDLGRTMTPVFVPASKVYKHIVQLPYIFFAVQNLGCKRIVLV